MKREVKADLLDRYFPFCLERMVHRRTESSRWLSRHRITASKETKFRLDLFAAFFCISAMVLALGKDSHREISLLYQRLIRCSSKENGVWFAFGKAQKLFREQHAALESERRNLGSGQYALALLYEQALDGSLKKKKFFSEEDDKGEKAFQTGGVVAEELSVWARLYHELGGQPMQVYTEGFKPSPRDTDPFHKID